MKKEIKRLPSDGKEDPQVNRQTPLKTGTGSTTSQSANPWIPIDEDKPQWYVGCDILCKDGNTHLNWARVTSDGDTEYFCNNRDDRIIYVDEIYMWRLTEFANLYGKSKPTEDPTF